MSDDAVVRPPVDAHGAGRAGAYGIDGGTVAVPVFGLLEAGLVGATVWALRRRRYWLGLFAGAVGSAVVGFAGSYLYSSLCGKFAVWSEILDELRLRGDERILDIGCGRGAVLLLAARRLPMGRAVGVDVWRRRDQSGNTRVAAEHNASVEGVADRVEFVDADARELPFPDGSFDVAVSNLAIHNIAGANGRNQALREAVRVLRPGGQLRIIDQRVARYPDPEALRAAGCVEITVRRLDWRMWFGTPGDSLTLVSASKPY
ncbi:MAG: methyltransferase domain-containing protein [Nocardioidaceae bacterium]